MNHSELTLVAMDAAPAGGASFLPTLVMMGVIGAIFYFLIIRPQQKEKRAHDELLAALAKGAEVVTTGGIHGTVHSVEETTVVLDLGDRTRMTVDKGAIARRASEPAKKAE